MQSQPHAAAHQREQQPLIVQPSGLEFAVAVQRQGRAAHLQFGGSTGTDGQPFALGER